MRKYIFLLLIGILSDSVFGQYENFIPEPNAVSLMTPVEIPASHYNGVPNISIPLYNLEYFDFTMPISISYQASGIQVAQESSNIGLGWSLNAGGTISRVIRGYNDFIGGKIEGYSSFVTYPMPVQYDISGYYYRPDVINKDSVTSDLLQRPTICGWTHFYSLFDGTEVDLGNNLILPHDMEPDIFTYSFCGYTGKMFINRDGKFTFVDNNNLKVLSCSESHFVLQDANGIQYKFTAGTKSKSYNESREFRNSTLETVIDNPNGDNLSSQADVSSWNLYQVVLLNSKKINFEYTNNAAYKSHVRVSQTQVMNLPVVEAQKLENHLDKLLCYAGADNNYHYSFQIYEGEKVLKKITFGNNSIEFEQDTRLDLKNMYNSSDEQYRIKGIKVKHQDKIIKTIELYNDAYFNQNTSQTYKELYYRLKLDSVKINDQPAYVFTYNNQHPLPRKNSPSFDHWGYYNGNRNEDKNGDDEIHAFIKADGQFNFVHESDVVDQFNPLNYVNFLMKGANRNPDFNYAQTAILEEIKYPTGGNRKFHYNINQFYDRENSPIYMDSTINSLINIGTVASKEISFTISIRQSINLGGGVMSPFENNGLPDYESSPYWYAKIVDAETQQNLALLAYDGSSVSQTYKELSIPLEPGNYILKMQGDGFNGYAVFMDYYYKIGTTDYLKNGGGLRVERITDSNGKTRFFDYTKSDGYSSGELLSSPEYINIYYNGACIECGGPDLWGSGISWHNLIAAQRHSSTIRPIVGSSGASIGYSRVKEYLVSAKGDTSMTIHYFKSQPEMYRSYLLPNLPNIPILSNGLPDMVEYKKNNEIVKKEVYTHTKDNNRSYTHYACRQDMETHNIMFYINSNQWWKLTKKETTDYYPSGNIITIEEYDYNFKNYQLNKQTTYVEEQEKVEKIIKYPNDYLVSQVTDLENNNLVTKPIETRTYKGATLISGSQVKYDLLGNPVDVYNYENLTGESFTPNYPYTFTHKTNVAYYTNGRVKKVSKDNNVTMYYAWAYKSQYPVVKIESSNMNLNISSIQTAVGGLNLSGKYTKENIDNDIAALKAAIGNVDGMVSIYTYNPLSGITSQTDPRGRTTYYIYDEFGRLKEVRDHDYHLIKKHEYNYASDGQ